MRQKFFFSGREEQKNRKVALPNASVAINEGWYRGETTNYRPPVASLISPRAANNYILKGWLPESPAIRKDTRIMTFGSCFAGNIARYLDGRGYNLLGSGAARDNIFAVSCNEGIVNTFTMRQLFEWVYEDKAPNAPMWHDYGAQPFEFTPRARNLTKDLFDNAEVFIITVGLSEVWYDKDTGEVFSRAIPESVFDPDRHGFRVSTVEENRQNLEAVYRIIREHVPAAKIIVTLSPVPLLATFRPVSCITANSVSKAVLRVAVDELMREHKEEGFLYYWPSYEIVTECFSTPLIEDNRHVKQPVLDYIMTLFEHYWCSEALDWENEVKRYFEAAYAGGLINARVHKLVSLGKTEEALDLAKELRNRKRYPVAILLAERVFAEHPDGDIRELIETWKIEQRERSESLVDRKRAPASA